LQPSHVENLWDERAIDPPEIRREADGVVTLDLTQDEAILLIKLLNHQLYEKITPTLPEFLPHPETLLIAKLLSKLPRPKTA
jgi:hypothetical protein